MSPELFYRFLCHFFYPYPTHILHLYVTRKIRVLYLFWDFLGLSVHFNFKGEKLQKMSRSKSKNRTPKKQKSKFWPHHVIFPVN